MGLSCSFCGKHQKDVKKLVAGAGAGENGPVVYICDECIGLCNGILAKQGQEGGAATPETNNEAHCSFCGASLERVAHLIAGPPGPPPLFICDDCVDLCNDILADERRRV